MRSGEFPGFAWLTGLLDDAVGNAGLRVGAELMLFRKTLHTLEGVVADVGGGDQEVQMELQKEFLRRLAGEWPFRWLAPPQSRAFRLASFQRRPRPAHVQPAVDGVAILARSLV